MKIHMEKGGSVRIEMIPLIDIVFLLLVFFIYAMLSMAVHHSLPLALPKSTTAKLDKELLISITIMADKSISVDREPIPLDSLAQVLRKRAGSQKEPGVLLFADRSLPYQDLFRVLDQIRTAGIQRISLQAEVDRER